MIPQTGNPTSYYVWYQQKSGLQEREPQQVIGNFDTMAKLTRVLRLYYQVAQELLRRIRSQYIDNVDVYNIFVRRLEERLDNKIRVEESGAKYLIINGVIRIDGESADYEIYFQGNKGDFKKAFLEIARELIAAVTDENVPEEKDSSLILGNTYNIQPPKDPETIAVDLDNTIMDKDEMPIDGAKDALQKLKNKGFDIVIYTARFSGTPEEEHQSLMSYIEGLLHKHGIPFDDISISKPICKYYIDDRGVEFTNWDDVLGLVLGDLEEMNAQGPQDNEPTQLHKIKDLPSGSVVEVETSTEVEEQQEEPKRQSTFRILSQQEIAKKVYEKIGQDLF